MIFSRLPLIVAAAFCAIAAMPAATNAAPAVIPNGGPVEILKCLLTNCFFNGGATFDCPCKESATNPNCVKGIERGFAKFPEAKSRGCTYVGPGRR